MRRWIAAALMCLCLALAIAPGTALADSGGWTLGPQHDTLTKGLITLVNVTEQNGELTIGDQDDIPVFGDLDLTGSVTDGQGNSSYSIVSIEDGAFEGSGVTSVKLPSSMTSIGEGTFAYCTSLTSVEIPSSIREIGAKAFFVCPLETVSLGEGVRVIGEEAFSHCTRLRSIEIPDSVASIGAGAFEWCPSLSSVVIPGSVEVVEARSFSDCSALDSVTLEEGIRVIGDSAFYGCQSLTSVRLPESVEAIGNGAFESSSLESLEIPPSVETIGTDAFMFCSRLASVVIPDSVTSLGDFAFCYCSDLESVVLGEGIRTIGAYTFAECTSLTSIEILGSVDSIGEAAFFDCASLASFEIPSMVTSIGNEAFSGCAVLTSVDIPNSTTSIGSNAFSGCVSLTSVGLPSSVTSIGDSAFIGCAGLSRVTVFSKTPSQIGGNVFDSTSEDLIIVVPAASLDSYRKGWASYEDRLRAGYTLTVGGEEVGTLHAAGDKVSVSASADSDACHSFTGWRVASGKGTLDGGVFTMGDSDAVLEASYDEHHTWGAGGHCTVCGEIDPDFHPVVTSGDGASWRKGETGGLTFTSNAAYGDFERVLVDGVEVGRSLYTVEEGSTVVKLSAAYLGTLSEGEHTTSVVSSTGTASARFTVLSAAGSGDDGADGDVTPDGETRPDGGTAPDGGVAPGGNTNSDGGTAPDGNAGSNGAANSASDASPEGAAPGSGAEVLAATGDDSLPSVAVATLGAALAAAGALVLGRRRG